jgi:phosphoadenosine phosphosulfate reductase
MLIVHHLFGTENKVEIAIERLRKYEPTEGYYLAFSGGKDSICIYYLAKMAGVKFDVHYNLTTVDPPELVRFVKTFDDVKIEKPEITMWRLIIKKKMPPTRIMRYCCDVLKERGGIGRLVVTGVRWEESVSRRKNWDVYNKMRKQDKYVLAPIIDWTEEDVWEFIEQNKLPYCSLYDEGYSRLGCIGCPQQGSRGMERDFKRWPKYKKQYLRTFERMLKKRKEEGYKGDWKTAEDVMNWWIYGKQELNDDLMTEDYSLIKYFNKNKESEERK